MSMSMKTAGPIVPTTDAGAASTTRDPSSVLPSIPAARKESSGAFPLPGMAPPEAAKSGDDDVTLIARLVACSTSSSRSRRRWSRSTRSCVGDRGEERSEGGATIALADQALAEREKALGIPGGPIASAAAEFEDPGDDDELTVSATPGIISISEDDEDDEPTASQRPPSARKTPTPATGGPQLRTPAPLLGGAPRLPAPSPPPGRTMRLPTPTLGLLSVPMPLASPASAPQRSLTPALPIPAPLGTPAAGTTASSAIFNKVQLPMGGLVAFLVAAFTGGLVLGALLWRGEARRRSPRRRQRQQRRRSLRSRRPRPHGARARGGARGRPTDADHRDDGARGRLADADYHDDGARGRPADAGRRRRRPPPRTAKPVHHVVAAHPKPVAHKAPAASPKPAVASATKPAL